MIYTINKICVNYNNLNHENIYESCKHHKYKQVTVNRQIKSPKHN